MVYTGAHPPPKLQGEEKMNKEPLKVIPSRADEKLDSRSRLNLGKVYSIEWNTKVKEIGRLDGNSQVKLLAYWRQNIIQ